MSRFSKFNDACCKNINLIFFYSNRMYLIGLMMAIIYNCNLLIFGL